MGKKSKKRKKKKLAKALERQAQLDAGGVRLASGNILMPISDFAQPVEETKYFSCLHCEQDIDMKSPAFGLKRLPVKKILQGILGGSISTIFGKGLNFIGKKQPYIIICPHCEGLMGPCPHCDYIIPLDWFDFGSKVNCWLCGRRFPLLVKGGKPYD